MLKLNSQQADPNSHYLREGMICFQLKILLTHFLSKPKEERESIIHTLYR